MVKVKYDLTGMRFNRLKVLKQSEIDYYKPDGRKEAKWICQCDCGVKTTARGHELKNGHKQSCGCLQKEQQIINGCTTKNLIHNTRHYNYYDLSGEYGVGYTYKNQKFYFDLEDFDKIKNILGILIKTDMLYLVTISCSYID